ncbi:MAG: universal stress protein [Cereibacter sphaeroides]|uniref:Universal stress protein n=1 Tax=Cereibacter sphaeroides TaxID=1063 RepID=A0A2W5S4Q0_CERSP|nr:MAG: universal stress protein [Cereibacter sphaeroides]
MYHTILLAYDGTREGRLALREGARMAQICKARVVLLAVVDVSVGVGLAETGASTIPLYGIEDFEKILDEGAERLTRMGLAYETRLETGLPAERILAVSKAIGADLVVVGHQKKGLLSRWLTGSVAASLNDSLDCSLLIARMEIPDEVLFGKD